MAIRPKKWRIRIPDSIAYFLHCGFGFQIRIPILIKDIAEIQNRTNFPRVAPSNQYRWYAIIPPEIYLYIHFLDEINILNSNIYVKKKIRIRIRHWNCGSRIRIAIPDHNLTYRRAIGSGRLYRIMFFFYLFSKCYWLPKG